MSNAVIHVPSSAHSYALAIEGLTELDQQLLTAKTYPGIYSAGVVYRKERGDTWRHVEDVVGSGWGDCEDLAAWRAAELRVSGEDPGARVYVYKSGEHMFHAVVGLSDGRIEDPSLKLGMPVSAARRATMPQTVAECEGEDFSPLLEGTPMDTQNAFAQLWGDGPPCATGSISNDPQPTNRSIAFDFYKTGRGWSGVLRLPVKGAQQIPGTQRKAVLLSTTPTASKTAAANKTKNLAKAALSSPLIRSLMPPQAQLALKALQSAPAKKLISVALKLKKFW